MLVACVPCSDDACTLRVRAACASATSPSCSGGRNACGRSKLGRDPVRALRRGRPAPAMKFGAQARRGDVRVRRPQARSALFGLAVALVLADSSVVTLALPDILARFDVGITEVAWVLISYNLVLAAAAVPAAHLVRRGRAPLPPRARRLRGRFTRVRAGGRVLGPDRRSVRAGAGGALVVAAALVLLVGVRGRSSARHTSGRAPACSAPRSARARRLPHSACRLGGDLPRPGAGGPPASGRTSAPSCALVVARAGGPPSYRRQPGAPPRLGRTERGPVPARDPARQRLVDRPRDGRSDRDADAARGNRAPASRRSSRVVWFAPRWASS